MAISQFTEATNVIGSLGDNPVTDNNLTVAQFKAKFDQVGTKIKEYINSTIVPAINNILSNGFVTTDKIADGAVTNEKLANDAVIADKLAEGVVSTLKLADGAVTGAKLASDAIDNSKLAAGAVTTAKIANGAVNTDQLAINAVKADNIAGGQILTRHLGYRQIDTEKIAELAVTASKLAGGSVTSAKFATDNDTKYRTRKIFVQASAPTSGMSDGDIWIKPINPTGGWTSLDIKVMTVAVPN